MGLLGDIEEAKKHWKQSTKLYKLIVIFSIILATSSLTSIADIVFKWKGFILTGILFFRTYVSHPIRQLFSFLGLHFSDIQTDVLILTSLAFGSVLRAVFLNWSKATDGFTVLMISILLYIQLRWLLDGYQDDPIMYQ
ncbi:MAG: hypothetical protein NXI20_18375, partial [bacterium]|nr:hypothetical protein [bacterium]